MDRPPSAAEPAPRAGEFRVQLPSFEGPLDLLLHLIKKHELDILDLPVAFIAERYLEYIRVMRELDLDVAGEYLLMAATLTHIKSKMLLPRVPAEQQEDAEAGEEQDPRLELIRRLLEYQKYKSVAEELGNRSVEGRDVFTRGMPGTEAQGPAPLAEISLFKLLDAFQGILDRAHDRLGFEVTAERISIQERMTQITDMLRERRACTFEELFVGAVTRYEIVVTFLALLEMTKMHVTRIYQTDPNSPIHVQYALLDASEPTVPPPSSQPAAEAEGARSTTTPEVEQTPEAEQMPEAEQQAEEHASDAPADAPEHAHAEPEARAEAAVDADALPELEPAADLYPADEPEGDPPAS